MQKRYHEARPYNSSTSSIKDQELGTLALTQRLGELASQNTQTTASYTEMKAIIDQLNADVPGLGLTYDGVTESVDATVEATTRTNRPSPTSRASGAASRRRSRIRRTRPSAMRRL